MQLEKMCEEGANGQKQWSGEGVCQTDKHFKLPRIDSGR